MDDKYHWILDFGIDRLRIVAIRLVSFLAKGLGVKSDDKVGDVFSLIKIIPLF